jgi:hypothetical protein
VPGPTLHKRGMHTPDSNRHATHTHFTALTPLACRKAVSESTSFVV